MKLIKRTYADYYRNYYRKNKARYAKSNKKYHQGLAPLVYRWRDKTGTVYVGRGTYTRMMSHKHKSKWWTPDMTYAYMICRNEWHAMHMEGLWGEIFQPKYNKEGNRR